LQTDKGAGATDFNALKAGAVMMAAPAAETFAIKDAADKLGKLFGKDLNRKVDIIYDNLANTFEAKTTTMEAKQALSELLSICQDNELRDSIVNEVMQSEQQFVFTSQRAHRLHW
jgi:hypothetical protein